MMNKTTMIVNAVINPEAPDLFQEYGKKATVIFESVGAILKSKYLVGETFIGQSECQLISITEFPSIDVLKNTFLSKEYTDLIPLRKKAFSKLDAFISN